MNLFKKITKKLSTIVALTLVALSLSFASLPTFAQSDLVPDPCPESGCPITGGDVPTDVSREEIADVILSIANILTYVIGALTVLFVVVGALLMVIGKNELGVKMVKNALIGFIISILAYTVVFLIGSAAQGNYLGF